MLRISIKRFGGITKLKFKTMMNANLIVAPLFALLMTGLLRVVYLQISGGGEIPDSMLKMVVNLGLTFNIGMTGIYITSAMLAEEKENNTLRVLMTSSVTATEFFLGSILPPLVIMIVVNILILPVGGLVVMGANIIVYLIITTIASITSCILGMIVGIFAKTQVSASTLSLPLLLIITMLPTFSTFIPALQVFSKCIFTGVITEMVDVLAARRIVMLNGLQMLILIGEIILSFALFIIVYRSNGFEKD